MSRPNPFAALAEPDVDGLIELLRAIPDPAYVTATRDRLVDLCDAGWYVDSSICASAWLNAIADHAYRMDGAP